MAKINWSETGKRFFEAGIDRGVFYPNNNAGVSWDGLVAVQETPTDSDLAESHYDGQKFVARRRSGSYSASIEAYSYPKEFDDYNGRVGVSSAQNRDAFNFSYRSLIGSDVDGISHGYLIHLVYNALAAPTTSAYKTESTSTEVAMFSWQISTRPIAIKDTYGSHLIIDTRVAYPWAVEALEGILYGNDISPPTLPSPEYIIDLFEDASILKITDHGDGSWTAEGPDDVVKMLDATSFEISWPTAVYIDDETYQLSSL